METWIESESDCHASALLEVICCFTFLWHSQLNYFFCIPFLHSQVPHDFHRVRSESPSRWCTMSRRSGARSATTSWTHASGRRSMRRSRRSQWTASQIPRTRSASVWACCRTWIGTRWWSRHGDTLARACDCIISAERCLPSVSATRASSCRVQIVISGTAGTRPLSAKFHQVSETKWEWLKCRFA